MFEDSVIPLDEWVSLFVDWLVDNYRDVFQALKWPVEQTLNGFDAGLNALSPLIVIAVLAFAAWRFSGKGLAIFTIVTLTITGLLGLWQETMTTLAMVLSSVIFCALAGIPLGIWAGRSDAEARVAGSGASPAGRWRPPWWNGTGRHSGSRPRSVPSATAVRTGITWWPKRRPRRPARAE